VCPLLSFLYENYNGTKCRAIILLQDTTVATQVPLQLLNPKVHCGVNNTHNLSSILSRTNPVCIIKHQILRLNLMLCFTWKFGVLAVASFHNLQLEFFVYVLRISATHVLLILSRLLLSRYWLFFFEIQTNPSAKLVYYKTQILYQPNYQQL